MKWLRRLSLIPIVWLVAHFCHLQTDGFSLSKVAVYLPYGSDPLPLDEQLDLTQPFTYLAKGGQCYVFASEDGKSVLKLFRSSRLGLLSAFPSLFPKALAKEKQQLEETLESVELAATRLTEETGLLFAHLKSDRCELPYLKIIDKLGITHTIDPMKTPFFIQKRALPVKEALLSWKLEGNLDAAREGMASLAQLIQLERDKEISDGDPNLSKNFGFCGERALQIDVGRFGKEASLASSKEDLQHFINANLPELSDFFDSLFQPLIESHESAPVLSDR